MPRRRTEIDAGAEHDRLGNHELAGVGLGEALDAAGGVDGVADRGDRTAVPYPISPTMAAPV